MGGGGCTVVELEASPSWHMHGVMLECPRHLHTTSVPARAHSVEQYLTATRVPPGNGLLHSSQRSGAFGSQTRWKATKSLGGRSLSFTHGTAAASLSGAYEV